MPVSIIRQLESAGFTPTQAEAIDAVVDFKLHDGQDSVATKADLILLQTTTKADLDILRATTRADLYRALWLHGAGVVTILGVLLTLLKTV